MPRVEKDYEELLRLLNKNRVKYCIIGAFAVAFHSRPRYTKLDLLIEPTPANARRIIRAIYEFGFKSTGLQVSDFTKSGIVVQLGYEPIRIDLLTSIEGCSFREVWNNKTPGVYGKQRVYFIGRNELIKNKMSSEREQDAMDLKELLRKK
ncbi:MAG: hypothetical protein QME51_07540 [Planctomycetota bacterium]|nr:hypothetical protein [Planctomycetota bacterium]MDI6788208.1 hypothetical protein [Planctomycetota bacterium]